MSLPKSCPAVHRLKGGAFGKTLEIWPGRVTPASGPTSCQDFAIVQEENWDSFSLLGSFVHQFSLNLDVLLLLSAVPRGLSLLLSDLAFGY